MGLKPQPLAADATSSQECIEFEDTQMGVSVTQQTGFGWGKSSYILLTRTHKSIVCYVEQLEKQTLVFPLYYRQPLLPLKSVM